MQVELVPAPVLSVGTYEGDPCVAPDGRFLVFYSGRAGGFGGVDLHVSFPDGKGEWTNPVNLGADFNTDSDEYGATLSPDGKYLFFVRHNVQKGEIYWVSTSAIEKLRLAPAVTANLLRNSDGGRSFHAYLRHPGKPSEVVQDHEAMLALALQVEKDLKADLEKLDIQDKGALQRIYSGLYGSRDAEEGPRRSPPVPGAGPRASGKPGRAAPDGRDHGSVYAGHGKARRRLPLPPSARCCPSGSQALPYQDVQGTLKAMKDGLETASKAQLIGGLAAGLDPAVKDGQLNQAMASGLVSAAMNLEVILPVKDEVVASIKEWLEANKDLQAAVPPAPTVLGTIKPRAKRSLLRSGPAGGNARAICS